MIEVTTEEMAELMKYSAKIGKSVHFNFGTSVWLREDVEENLEFFKKLIELREI